MKRKKYLVNGFCGLTICMKDFLNYDFEELSFRTRKFDFINNYLKIILWRILGKLKKYDIVKYNTWEGILASKKYKGQILIGESHGFHFGLNFQDTIKHFKGLKKVVAYIIEFLLGPVIRYKIKKLDIYYVSTPNMLEFAKKIRPDAKRLPNSIDSTFTNKGPIIKLRGNPSIFWPTRLHSFKNPQFGLNLFKKIKQQFPNAVLHLIESGRYADSTEQRYKQEFKDNTGYVRHPFQTHDELAKMFRGCDMVLGNFNPTYGMCSLIELEATICGAPVISYDKYEIKTPLEELENLALTILHDKHSRDEYIEKNMEIILKNHSYEGISNLHINDISLAEKNIQIIPFKKSSYIKYCEEITKIENEMFYDIGIRDKKNFLLDFNNKFDVSFLILMEGKCIGYIIGYSYGSFGYINRLAISKIFQGQGFGNLILNYFLDNLKYNYGINNVEVVSHMSLNVKDFYMKNSFNLMSDNAYILDFLSRKNKLVEKSDYIGEKKTMILLSKDI